jgi:hypothetical protein
MLNEVSNMMSRLIDFALCPVCLEEKHYIPYSNGRKICAKCKNELIVVKLRLLDAKDEIPNNCPFCGKEREEDDTIYRKYRVVVFRCKKCGRFDGYKYNLEDDDWGYGFDLSDEMYPRKTMKIAEKEGKPITSASAIKKIIKKINKKKKDPKLKCREQLNGLIKEKSKPLKSARVDPNIMETASQLAHYLIRTKGAYTAKQLKILYSAAILAAQEKLMRNGSITKKTTSERQLSEIFKVDRKTLRKWKRRLLNEKLKGVLSHQIDFADETRNQKGNTAIS